MDNFVVFDLETTGFSPESNEIIEIGAWKVKDGVVVDKFSQLIKPYGFIPKNVRCITGITNEMVMDCDTYESVLLEFFDFCEDLPFLGHNLEFDFGFVHTKGRNIGIDFSLNGQRQGVCTLKLTRKFLPDISHKLGDLVEYYGISKDLMSGDFHRAYYDAYMTKLIYDRLKDKYGGLISLEPVDLVEKNKYYGKVSCDESLDFE